MATSSSPYRQYDMGDVFWAIRIDTQSHPIVCPFCKGKGEITGADGTTRSCPQCFGTRESFSDPDYDHKVIGPYTICEIRLTWTARRSVWSYANDSDGEEVNRPEVVEWHYMAEETGIGSGTLWYEDKIWPTEAAAQAAADERNTE